MSETFSRATVESSIASACRWIAKLELPDNARDDQVQRRVDQIETEAAQRMLIDPAPVVLGWLRKRVQELATGRELRRQMDVANQMRSKRLAKQKTERRKR